jgi:hypothetical protein
MRVPPPDMKAIHDTLAVVRYGIDMEMAAKAKLIVVCYITNPKRWKGTPNLACVASPLTP